MAPRIWLETTGQDGKGFPAFFRAYKHFLTAGNSELAYARTYFNANTIEYSVSQAGYDVEDSSFTPAQHSEYISDIARVVSLARGMGFVVILSVNDASPLSGNTNRYASYPDDSTARVNVALGRTYGGDREIMLEVTSESWPADQRASTADLWRQYIDGGSGREGDAEVGINDILRDIRSTGAKNVLLVQPFFSKGWAGYPNTIVDPLGQLAFAVHPYMVFTGTTRGQWDAYFGRFARNHPTVVTEWHENAGPLGNLRYDWCTGQSTIDLPRQKLAYFDEVGIDGVVGWAWDVPGTLLDGFEGKATRQVNCGAPSNDVGELLKSHFGAGSQ